METKFQDKKRQMDVDVAVEVKGLKARVHELQQQLHSACDADAEARRCCQQLVLTLFEYTHS